MSILYGLNSTSTIPNEPLKSCSDSLYQRDEKEDIKTAIDYLYDFNKKLSALHPKAKSVIVELLQVNRHI